MLRSQLVVLGKLLIIRAIIQPLLDTEAVCLHIAVAIEASYLLAKSAFQGTIFQGNHLLVVSLQALEHLLIETRDIARVDERSVNAFLLLQHLCHLLAQAIEGTEGYDGYLAALVGHLEAVQL